MPPTTLERSAQRSAGALVPSSSPHGDRRRREPAAGDPKGFGAGGFGGGRPAKGGKRKAGGKRGPALSKADWGPLGKHPDLDAIVARQRLHLPLSGRLSEGQVNQAWKRCAAEHHPDRGGAHDTMQLVNGARDLLLGRGQTPHPKA